MGGGGGGGAAIIYFIRTSMPMVRSWPWHGPWHAMAWVEARLGLGLESIVLRCLGLALGLALGLVAKTGKHARINNHSRSMCCTIHISANNCI